jgi:ERCC4-related helicase
MGWVTFPDLNLLVLDDCHTAVRGSDLSEVMRLYEAVADSCPSLRLLGLTASILGKDSEPHQIQDCILTMERGLKSHVEAASEITSTLRHESQIPRAVETDSWSMVVTCEAPHALP